MNRILCFLVYLGYSPQFKETVELSYLLTTLTHLFNLSARAKDLNTKFEDYRAPQAQAIPVFGIGEIFTFWKNLVEVWGEHFLQFLEVAKWFRG